MEKPDEQKTIRHTDRRTRLSTSIFPSEIQPSIQLPRHSIVLKEQWGKRRSLFFVSKLLFRYLAVDFERGFGPAKLIHKVTQMPNERETYSSRSGIRIYDYSVRATEDCAHLIRCGHCDRPQILSATWKQEWRYDEYGSHMGRRNTSKQCQVQYEKLRKNVIIEISLMNFGERERVGFMLANLAWAILASFFPIWDNFTILWRTRNFLIIWATVIYASKTLSNRFNLVLSRAVNLELAHLKLVPFMKLFHVCCHDLIVWPWTWFSKYGNEASSCMKIEIIWVTISVRRRRLLWSSL
jgi:hypothetical protein